LSRPPRFSNNLNVLVRIAQEQLGHAGIDTTPDIYTYAVDASLHRSAVEAVERELFVILDPSGHNGGKALVHRATFTCVGFAVVFCALATPTQRRSQISIYRLMRFTTSMTAL